MINKLRKRKKKQKNKKGSTIYGNVQVNQVQVKVGIGREELLGIADMFAPIFLVTRTGANTFPMFLMFFGKLTNNFFVGWFQLAKESEHETIARGVNISHARQMFKQQEPKQIEIQVSEIQIV